MNEGIIKSLRNLRTTKISIVLDKKQEIKNLERT